MPTMLDSATGVSMIRSAPNSSMKPSETRKTPPRTPTSSPRRMWRSSRRNSPSSVSWTAWTFDFSVTGPLYLFERRELVGPALADETAGLRDGSHDRPVHVEGEERLHVDDLGAYARVDQILRRLLSDAAERALGHERDVAPLANDLGHAERHRELADVVRHALLQP